MKENILNTIPSSWKNHDAVIAKRIYVDNPKFMKLVKKGFKSYIKDPSILFSNKKQTVKLHFDMFHGYGILDKAIDLLNKNDRSDFYLIQNNNYCYIKVYHDPKKSQILIVSLIDNLIKGAAGQATQCFNISFNLNETLGLENI